MHDEQQTNGGQGPKTKHVQQKGNSGDLITRQTIAELRQNGLKMNERAMWVSYQRMSIHFQRMNE